jgi:hypothetical protein
MGTRCPLKRRYSDAGCYRIRSPLRDVLKFPIRSDENDNLQCTSLADEQNPGPTWAGQRWGLQERQHSAAHPGHGDAGSRVVPFRFST